MIQEVKRLEAGVAYDDARAMCTRTYNVQECALTHARVRHHLSAARMMRGKAMIASDSSAEELHPL